jgi:hypothetical protein
VLRLIRLSSCAVVAGVPELGQRGRMFSLNLGSAGVGLPGFESRPPHHASNSLCFFQQCYEKAWSIVDIWLKALHVRSKLRESMRSEKHKLSFNP